LYETTASSKVTVPICRQPVMVRRRRKFGPWSVPVSGGLDAKGQAVLRRLMDLRHDLVAEVELLAGNHGLLRRDEELQERRCASRSTSTATRTSRHGHRLQPLWTN
jgi:hypothetical protein